MFVSSCNKKSNNQLFRQIAENMSNYYSEFGIKLKPYHDSALPAFSRLSDNDQIKALFYLNLFWIITQSSDRTDFKNNAKALWAAMKVAGFKCGFSFFQYLEDDDKIEIYNLNGVQLWRNLNMLEVCSYTLEEMHCYDWVDRYERNESDTNLIFRAIESVVQSKSPQPMKVMIPEHLVREKFSESKFLLSGRHNYFYPLLDNNNQVSAFLVTSKVKILRKFAQESILKFKPSHLSLVVKDKGDLLV